MISHSIAKLDCGKAITGAIGTKLSRKEFALRKDEMKLMKAGCCSSFHALLIIQTPTPPE